MKGLTLPIILGLFITTIAHGQVGINTSSPKATLDVVGKTNNGTRPEGIIAPRLTGDALFAASGTGQYGNDQDGAIVYVTEAVSPGNDTRQTANINVPGYYFFDSAANEWKKIGEGGTIYTSDGALTNPRLMDMDDHTLGFINGRVSVGTDASHPSSILELQSVTRGFLPPRMTKVQMDAIVNPSLGLMVYCTDCFVDTGCLMINDSPDETTPKWGSLCSSNAPTPIVLILDCAGTLNSGTLYSGQAASGVTSTVPYTGGNGGVYQAMSFNSTGVTGLVADLPGGVLNNGNGNLVFNITGTPSAVGTATFNISIAGQSCSFTVPVSSSAASVGSLNCTSGAYSPTTLSQDTAYNGTLSVPYTGGNGAAYPQASFTQNGLTFTLPAGTLNNGNGNLVYTVTGYPTNSGAMSVPISFDAVSCNVSKTVAVGTTVVMPGNNKAWMQHNLGANTSLDPHIPVQGIHGNYYQWGKMAPVATASTPSGAIIAWNTAVAPNNAWTDGSKTAIDPCPSGFRVPTSQQFENLINNTSHSNIGTFTNSAANFGSAKVFMSGANKMTLPAAGYRSFTDGALGSRGSIGRYWNSTQDFSPYSYLLSFTQVGVNVVTSHRVAAYSIRCIQE